MQHRTGLESCGPFGNAEVVSRTDHPNPTVLFHVLKTIKLGLWRLHLRCKERSTAFLDHDDNYHQVLKESRTLPAAEKKPWESLGPVVYSSQRQDRDGM